MPPEDEIVSSSDSDSDSGFDPIPTSPQESFSDSEQLKFALEDNSDFDQSLDFFPDNIPDLMAPSIKKQKLKNPQPKLQKPQPQPQLQIPSLAQPSLAHPSLSKQSFYDLLDPNMGSLSSSPPPPPPEDSPSSVPLVPVVLHCSGCNQHTVIGINSEAVAAGHQINGISCMNCNTYLDTVTTYIQTIEYPGNLDSCLTCGWVNVG